MPISPEHLSALRAYERLWHSDATDADLEAPFAPGLRDYRLGATVVGSRSSARTARLPSTRSAACRPGMSRLRATARGWPRMRESPRCTPRS